MLGLNLWCKLCLSHIIFNIYNYCYYKLDYKGDKAIWVSHQCQIASNSWTTLPISPCMSCDLVTCLWFVLPCCFCTSPLALVFKVQFLSITPLSFCQVYVLSRYFYGSCSKPQFCVLRHGFVHALSHQVTRHWIFIQLGGKKKRKKERKGNISQSCPLGLLLD